MLTQRIVLFILLMIGCYLLSSPLRVRFTQSALVSHKKPGDLIGKLLYPVVRVVAKAINLTSYKRRKLLSDLERAEILQTPEEFYASAVVFAVGMCILSALMLLAGLTVMDTATTTMLAFSAGGASQNKAITVPAGASGSSVFTWTPGSVGNVTVSANINPDKVIDEIDYGNNILSESVMVKEIVDPADPNDTPDPVPLIDPPAGENNDYVEWVDPYGTVYWARLSLTATPSVTKLKSGYGFDVVVTPVITTNCPDSSVILQPQAVVMRIPESHYETGVQLVKSGTSWSMPVNPISVIGSKVWFVPIWFPDVPYIGVVTAYGAFTPGGELTASMPVTIAINGSMYEDDSTNNAWGG